MPVPTVTYKKGSDVELAFTPIILAICRGVDIGIHCHRHAQSVLDSPHRSTWLQPGFGVVVIKPYVDESGLRSRGPKAPMPIARQDAASGCKVGRTRSPGRGFPGARWLGSALPPGSVRVKTRPYIEILSHLLRYRHIVYSCSPVPRLRVIVRSNQIIIPNVARSQSLLMVNF